MKTKISLILILFIISFNIKNATAQTWSALGAGLLYPVNSFALYSGNLCAANYGVSVWNGTTWTDMSNGLKAMFGSGDVYAIANYNNVLFSGGSFTVFTPDGNWYNNAARFSNGSWTTCGSGKGNDGSGMSEIVICLIEYGGQLYAGGKFGTAGGDPSYPKDAAYIARFDGTEWYSVGGGMDYTVTDMIAFNSELIVSGYFTHAAYLNSACAENPEKLSANYIAKWNGTIWSPLGSGMDGKVTALVVHNGELYAGGSFGNAGGKTADNIAKWNGSSWSAVGSGLNGQVYDLVSYDGSLYAGGAGFMIDNNTHYIAKWNGTNWAALGLGVDNSVLKLIVNNNDLYVGGSFINAGGKSAMHVAKFSCTTGLQDNIINNKISIFPNPGNGKFMVEGIGELTITNLYGEAIISQKLINQRAEIDLTRQPKGIYLAKMVDGTTIHTERIVIQ